MKPKSRAKSPSRAAILRPDSPRPEKVISPVITSRDDLPFTARDTHDALIDWQPERNTPAVDFGRSTGYAYALAVAQLANVDEYEAYCAIKHALLSSDWNPEQPEEHGFVDGIVRMAMIGMRAKASDESLPFATSFDPEHSMFCSLLEQVDVMKAQFKAMNVKPWRTYAEAGLA